MFAFTNLLPTGNLSTLHPALLHSSPLERMAMLDRRLAVASAYTDNFARSAKAIELSCRTPALQQPIISLVGAT